MDNRPIGVFDSGLGGLTVLKEIRRLLPNESLVYFGDCARIPYGTKSKDTIVKYACQDVRFLLEKDVKLIVVACNTASACSLDEIRSAFKVKVIEVIKPGARAALETSANKKIGIVGTPATIDSGVYQKALKDHDSDVETYTVACPLFVPLVEEGWWDDRITYEVAQRYLSKLKSSNIDTLILGCTHYPLLQNVISRVMGDSVTLINSAKEIAKRTRAFILKNDMSRDEELKPEYRFYTSDSVEKFSALSAVFLGKPLKKVEKIDIERY